jgi:hypothetical protein
MMQRSVYCAEGCEQKIEAVIDYVTGAEQTRPGIIRRTYI